jgi:hypothetical protein
MKWQSIVFNPASWCNGANNERWPADFNHSSRILEALFANPPHHDSFFQIAIGSGNETKKTRNTLGSAAVAAWPPSASAH